MSDNLKTGLLWDDILFNKWKRLLFSLLFNIQGDNGYLIENMDGMLNFNRICIYRVYWLVTIVYLIGYENVS